jgi:uracil-DNA glycosylase
MDESAAWQALALQFGWGADEAILDEAVDRLATARAAARPAPEAAPVASPVPSPAHPRTAGEAAARAEQAASLAELREAVSSLDLDLRATATNIVFAEGKPDGIVVLCDAPGVEDDAGGHPLSGFEGAYFDRMLASAGLSRQGHMLILPFVFWRPPGGRPPTQAEIGACQPFVRRALELARPRVILAFSGPPAASLLGRAAGGRAKSEGWRALEGSGLPSPVPLLVLPSPAACRADWRRRRDAWAALRLLVRRIGSFLT